MNSAFAEGLLEERVWQLVSDGLDVAALFDVGRHDASPLTQSCRRRKG